MCALAAPPGRRAPVQWPVRSRLRLALALRRAVGSIPPLLLTACCPLVRWVVLLWCLQDLVQLYNLNLQLKREHLAWKRFEQCLVRENNNTSPGCARTLTTLPMTNLALDTCERVWKNSEKTMKDRIMVKNFYHHAYASASCEEKWSYLYFQNLLSASVRSFHDCVAECKSSAYGTALNTRADPEATRCASQLGYA